MNRVKQFIGFRSTGLPGVFPWNKGARAFLVLIETLWQQALPGAPAPRPCRLGAQHRNSRERKSSECIRHRRKCSGQRPGGAERGFTVIESLTALAVLALVLTSLLGTFSNSLRVVRVADQTVHALGLAQSLLDQQLALPGQEIGVSRGEQLGMAWSITVAGDAGFSPGREAKKTWQIYRIIVTVNYLQGRKITLQSRKLSVLHG